MTAAQAYEKMGVIETDSATTWGDLPSPVHTVTGNMIYINSLITNKFMNSVIPFENCMQSYVWDISQCIPIFTYGYTLSRYHFKFPYFDRLATTISIYRLCYNLSCKPLC